MLDLDVQKQALWQPAQASHGHLDKVWTCVQNLDHAAVFLLMLMGTEHRALVLSPFLNFLNSI